MPCAAGELCLLPDHTPVAPDGHACQGVCGGRLHGTCGSVAGDNELHRICTTCVDATSHKRKGAVEEGGGGGQAKRPNQGKGKTEQKGKSGPRKRLTLDQKLAILKLLEERVAQDEIADRYECSVRTVRAVKAAKADLEKEASTAGKGDMKTKCKGDFPEVDQITLSLLEKAREAKIAVTRDAIRSFGRSAKETLLAAPASSAALSAKLKGFKAGGRWAKNFVKRNGLHSVRLHGEVGSVDHEAIKEGMEEIRALCAKFSPRYIFNVDETGLQWKIMPRRTYLSNHEDRKTARGSKGMTFKDRVSAFVCFNADGSAKVDMAIIGKAKEPRCFSATACPLKYFSQTNAWSDTATFLKWWREVFLTFVRRFTNEPVLLLLDGCSSHADLVDDRGQVTVKFYPPKCTAVHQPADQGVIVQTKMIYRRLLLDVKLSTMLVADTLRAQAKARKMKAGTAGLAEGHQPTCETPRNFSRQHGPPSPPGTSPGTVGTCEVVLEEIVPCSEVHKVQLCYLGPVARADMCFCKTLAYIFYAHPFFFARERCSFALYVSVTFSSLLSPNTC